MKTTINQVIRNTLDKDRNIISTQITETFILAPENGKVLLNTKTGETFTSTLSLGTKWKATDFIEVDQ